MAEMDGKRNDVHIVGVESEEEPYDLAKEAGSVRSFGINTYIGYAF